MLENDVCRGLTRVMVVNRCLDKCPIGKAFQISFLPQFTFLLSAISYSKSPDLSSLNAIFTPTARLTHLTLHFTSFPPPLLLPTFMFSNQLGPTRSSKSCLINRETAEDVAVCEIQRLVWRYANDLSKWTCLEETLTHKACYFGT